MNAEIIGLMFTHESAVPAHFTIKTSAAPAESSAGAVEVTLQIRDDEDEGQPDTEVWISTDADGASVVAGTKETNGDGEVTFMLDPGTYYRWAQKTGVNFTNPQQFTVT